jgi:cyclopropane-fatty-acyl-phospholipid synthase
MSPAAGAAGRAGAAGVLAPVLRQLCGGELPVRLRAWDGSETGPPGAPTVVLRNRGALRRLLWHPGELGAAQAYVTGDLDVEGDLTQALRALWQLAGERGLTAARLPLTAWPAAARAVLTLGAAGRPPSPPASQLRVRGRRHSRARDRAVIAHHYDLPAEFYQLFLDRSMSYSCAYWRSDAPDYTLADAQRDKLDLVCRRLGLGPGTRLLDLGCGWGALTVHAASRYGARVTAVTLSSQQGAYLRRRIRDLGLDPQVSVQVGDYRELTAAPFDAVACIEMGEHVGAAGYPAFCARLRELLRPGGLLLIQQMARHGRQPGGGPFIESFIAADMHMRPAGETAGLLENAGLEVCQVELMREHYHRTIRAWLAALEHRFAEAVSLVGPEVARVWRLYLAGGALAFEQGRMSVHQFLAARPGPGKGWSLPTAIAASRMGAASASAAAGRGRAVAAAPAPLPPAGPDGQVRA